MGEGDKKRSYAEFEHDFVPDIGLGATLAHIRELPQQNNLDALGAGLKNNRSLQHTPEEWTVVSRTSKKRTKRLKKDAISTAAQQGSNKQRDNRPSLTYAELYRIQSSLKISDLQNLIIYCLADGTSPQWVSVKHHSQVRKCVVLLVPGLERNMFDEDRGYQDVVPSNDLIEQRAGLDDATSGVSTDIPNTKHKDSPHSGSIRSPDDFLPMVLTAEKLPDSLKPLASVFGHLWPVKAPGDDKYNKVHSPMHAMLTSPLPKSWEGKGGDINLKNSKYMRMSATWKNERTPITSLLLSKDELQENGYTIHPAFYTSEYDRDFNIQRRQKANQLAEHGWIDTNVVDLIDADVPDTEIESGSITMGRTILALDCEMCMVEGGQFALTRISIVNWDGEVVMDDLVKPDKPITDYLTQYSGMTSDKLATTTTSLSDIQTRLLTLLTSRTIIIGHSLESDLTALKITHPFVIDTATIYPHPRGLPLKSSLKYLSQKYLNREIQKNHGNVGHDSIEDATACLDLVKQKCEKGLNWGTSEATSESLFKRLSRSSRPGASKGIGSYRTGAIVDHGTSERSFGGPADVHIQCDSDDNVVDGVKRAVVGDDDGAFVPGGGVDFTWARLRELGDLKGWTQDNSHSVVAKDGSQSSVSQNAAPSPETLSAAVSHTVEHILSIHASLPPCTLFIVYSGTGDRREMARLQKMHWQFKREYATKKWDELSVRWTDVEEQALRRSCGKARQGIGLITVT